MPMDLIMKVIELATCVVGLLTAVIKAVPTVREKRSCEKKDRR